MKERDIVLAYLIWFFLGLYGGHKFYLSKMGMGILYLLTAGLFGIGWLIDLFTLPKQVKRFNDQHCLSFDDPLAYMNRQEPPARHSRFFLQDPEGIEKIILHIAQTRGGLVSPMDIAANSPISMDRAKKQLESMVSRGFAVPEMTASGLASYRIIGL